MFCSDHVFTGEKVQLVCDAWCGTEYDFQINARLRLHLHKQVCLDKIFGRWENPRVLFCFPNRLDLLCMCLSRDLLMKPFVLVTHNSDTNIEIGKTSPCTTTYVLNHPLLIRWHAQNCGFDHPRMHPLPIGIANSEHPHGNADALCLQVHRAQEKRPTPFFSFTLHTNPEARQACKDALAEKGHVWIEPGMPYERYLEELAGHAYAFCPEGSGWDTHRLWECIHLGVVPVVLDTPFVRIVEKYLLPNSLCIIPSWSSFDPTRHEWGRFRTAANDSTLSFRTSISFMAAQIVCE